MIIINNASLSFGSRTIFDALQLNLQEGQRIGLVGANGTGKSTLLEIIAGIKQFDTGTITQNKNKKIAYLAQEVVLTSQLSILQETMTAFQDLWHLTQQIDELEKKRASQNLTNQENESYALLTCQLHELNPELARIEAEKMLMGLGFKKDDLGKPVTSLSIGWRMRIVLAKLLLQKADFYLFDEPTNHLDIFAKDWFLDFLANTSFGFLLVCHEQYFLDEVCTKILALDQSKARIYHGNYTYYLQEQEKLITLQEQAFIQQQKEIKQKEETIARFKASASRAKQAQSMIKQLEKIERIQVPTAMRKISFHFPAFIQPASIVTKINNLSFGYDHKRIFYDVNVEIKRGQKVALVASNGVGKSTLLHLISGKLPVQAGTICMGLNVKYALFDQDQNRALDKQKSVFENIDGFCAPGITSNQIRTLLGSFLFSGDDINKKVAMLSGGEKNRVGIVKTLLQNANFLLLDEPTNHLDIDSKKILLQALTNYQGTLLFVSHDRDFLNNLATRIIELTPNGVMSFDGNYEQYIYYKNHVLNQNKVASDNNHAHSPLKKLGKSDFDARKRSARLEKKIEMLEQKIKKQENDFAGLAYGTDEFINACSLLQQLKKDFESAMQEWESLNE